MPTTRYTLAVTESGERPIRFVIPAGSALKQAVPLRQLPDGITDLDQFRVQRRDRAGGRNSRISPGRVGFRHQQVEPKDISGEQV
jgi:hypothetical protein